MNFNLIQKRMERGLTQKKVAEAIGISTMAVGFYEKGLRTPRTEIKKKLANFYGCEESELFGKTKSNKEDFEALKQAAMPLVEYLRKIGDAHTTAVVTQRGVRLTQDLIGMPLDYED